MNLKPIPLRYNGKPDANTILRFAREATIGKDTGLGKPAGFTGRVRRVRVAGWTFSRPETEYYFVLPRRVYGSGPEGMGCRLDIFQT